VVIPSRLVISLLILSPPSQPTPGGKRKFTLSTKTGNRVSDKIKKLQPWNERKPAQECCFTDQ
jgi:hypothetical protein